MISGKFYRDHFSFHEGDEISFEKIHDVLSGKIPGCMFRGVLAKESCQKTTQNFLTNCRTKHREDGVPGIYLGTYHYKKALQEYLNESRECSNIMDGVFNGAENLFAKIIDGISTELGKYGKTVRVAEHNGQKACHYFMRKWQGQKSSEFALKPHDDDSQCTAKAQNGFEIQETVNGDALVALNMCLDNKGKAELHYWNVQPDDETKLKLGVNETGYPYPKEELEGIEKIVIPVEAGDLYFFNGKNVHAVSSPCEEDSHRITLSCLMGFKNDGKTLLHWT